VPLSRTPPAAPAGGAPDDAGPERLWPWLATLGGAGAVFAVTQGALWAYDRGLAGPRDPGQRLLLGGPVAAARAAQGLALAVAAYAGAGVLSGLRGRWQRYVEQEERGYVARGRARDRTGSRATTT
jgi:hypothetical protein